MVFSRHGLAGQRLFGFVSTKSVKNPEKIDVKRVTQIKIIKKLGSRN